MERCATCRHWAPPHNKPHAANFGTCEEIVHVGSGEPHPAELAYVTDYEGYSSWLKTRPDFGCVQWEGKET